MKTDISSAQLSPPLIPIHIFPNKGEYCSYCVNQHKALITVLDQKENYEKSILIRLCKGCIDRMTESFAAKQEQIGLATSEAFQGLVFAAK